MVFSSIPFLYFFLPACLGLFLITKEKYRNVVLLVFSLLFYWWGEPKYLLLMVFTITFCYVGGLLLEKNIGVQEKQKQRKLLFIFVLAVPLGFLCVFKYTDFFISSVNSAFGADFDLIKLALPVGISFYTFQAISYVIDVYWGAIPAERNFINLATYITLFPQLVAGPIVRYRDVMHEMNKRDLTLENFSLGVRRFVFGLGKKVLVANLLGTLCSSYKTSGDPSVLFAWLWAISYTLQIYFDFSAYSDMAIGLGKILGLHFNENFNYPYISTSVTEFWRRWHISLSSWFRDYVYIPLGGNRCKKSRHIFNLLVVWCLTGFWHGAGWNFIVWGLYFGVLLILEKYVTGKYVNKLPKILGKLLVFFIVIVSFVIFGAENFTEAIDILMSMFSLKDIPLVNEAGIYALRSNLVLLAVAFFGATPIMKKFFEKHSESKVLSVLEVVAVFAVLVLSTAYLVDGSFNPFLYFRF